MDLSLLLSTDGLAALLLIALLVGTIVAYLVLLRMERPETILPPEHRHILAETSDGLGAAADTDAAPSCNNRHDWKILYENVLPDDSSLITFWCRHCGTLTLQRDDIQRQHTSTVWKYEANKDAHGRPLLLLHTLPDLPMAWDFSTGTLTMIDTEGNSRIVLTPTFVKSS